MDFKQITNMAEVFVRSGFFRDVRDMAQAAVKIQAGAELGLPPFASMSGIHIIQGKAVLGSNVIATLIKQDARYNYRVVRCDEKVCELAFFEHGEESGRATFTMDEAKAAGLAGKDNWRKYPSDMLFARTITRGARRYCSGIFGGAPVYTPEELGVDVDEDGYIEQSAAESPVEDTLPPFVHGDAVLVAGKDDEKPGTVVNANGGGLVTVEIDGTEYKVKAERLALVPDEGTGIKEIDADIDGVG